MQAEIKKYMHNGYAPFFLDLVFISNVFCLICILQCFVKKQKIHASLLFNIPDISIAIFFLHTVKSSLSKVLIDILINYTINFFSLKEHNTKMKQISGK